MLNIFRRLKVGDVYKYHDPFYDYLAEIIEIKGDYVRFMTNDYEHRCATASKKTFKALYPNRVYP